jgi:hypothetical protein
MGEVLLKWGKLNFDKKKISANLNSKMHCLDKNSFSYVQKYCCTRFELPVGIEVCLRHPFISIFTSCGKHLWGRRASQRCLQRRRQKQEWRACRGVQGFTTRQDRWMQSAREVMDLLVGEGRCGISSRREAKAKIGLHIVIIISFSISIGQRVGLEQRGQTLP